MAELAADERVRRAISRRREELAVLLEKADGEIAAAREAEERARKAEEEAWTVLVECGEQEGTPEHERWVGLSLNLDLAFNTHLQATYKVRRLQAQVDSIGNRGDFARRLEAEERLEGLRKRRAEAGVA